MGSYVKPIARRARTNLLSFPSGGGGRRLSIVLQCIFRRDFPSLHTAVKTIPVPSYMSCCSDDLALLLSLRSLKS